MRTHFFCKYWNLQAVVMPDCSLIATRNSHAKHNQLVVRIPERRQSRLLNFSTAQVEIKRGKACVEEALTYYFDGNNP